MLTYLPSCLLAMLTYLPACLPTCLPACLLTYYLPACLPTCLPACLLLLQQLMLLLLLLLLLLLKLPPCYRHWLLTLPPLLAAKVAPPIPEVPPSCNLESQKSLRASPERLPSVSQKSLR